MSKRIPRKTNVKQKLRRADINISLYVGMYIEVYIYVGKKNNTKKFKASAVGSLRQYCIYTHPSQLSQ